MIEIAIGLVLGLVAGAAIGYAVRRSIAQRNFESAEARARAIVQDAERAAGTRRRSWTKPCARCSRRRAGTRSGP